ncbi:MAG: hypothetical protein FWF35_00015 [Elusimicrobia bacterium]|nr:hypothetical protein [Elusimicrobiota bacterium]
MHKKLILTAVILALLPLLHAQSSFLGGLQRYKNKLNADIVQHAAQVYNDACAGNPDGEDCINALNNDDSAFKAAGIEEFKLSLFLLNNNFSFKARGKDNERFFNLIAETAYFLPKEAQSFTALLDKTKDSMPDDLDDLIAGQDNSKHNAVHTAVIYTPENKKVKNMRTASQNIKPSFQRAMLKNFAYDKRTKQSLCKALIETDIYGKTPFHIALANKNKEAFFNLMDASDKAGCDSEEILNALNQKAKDGVSVTDSAFEKAAGQRYTDNSFYADLIIDVLKGGPLAGEEQQQYARNKLQNAKSVNISKAKQAVASAAEGAGINRVIPPDMLVAIPAKIVIPADTINTAQISQMMNRSKVSLAVKPVQQTSPEEVTSKNITSENKQLVKSQPDAEDKYVVTTSVNDSIKNFIPMTVVNDTTAITTTAAADTITLVNKNLTAYNTPANKTGTEIKSKRPVVANTPKISYTSAGAAKRPVVKTSAQNTPAPKYKTVPAAAKAAADKYAYWRLLDSMGGKSSLAKAQAALAFRDYQQADKDLTETAKAKEVSPEKAKEYFYRNAQQDYMLAQNKNTIIGRPEIQMNPEPVYLAVKTTAPARSSNTAKAAENKPADIQPATAQANKDSIDSNPFFKIQQPGWPTAYNPVQRQNSNSTKVSDKKQPSENTVTAEVKNNINYNSLFTQQPAGWPPAIPAENTALQQNSKTAKSSDDKQNQQKNSNITAETHSASNITDAAVFTMPADDFNFSKNIPSSNGTKVQTAKTAAAPSADKSEDGAVMSALKWVGKKLGVYSEPKPFVGLDKIYGEENFKILREKAEEIGKVHDYATAPLLPGLANDDSALRKKWKDKEQRLIDKYMALAKQNPEGYDRAIDLLRPMVSSTCSNLKPYEVPAYTNETDSTAVNGNNKN